MLTFVIVDYFSAFATLNCIKHFIKKCEGYHNRISFVIVDNSVNDDNFKQLLSLVYLEENLVFEGQPLIKSHIDGIPCLFWKSAKNLGFAQGNNVGVKIANYYIKSEYFIFSNNDLVVLDKNLDIEKMISKIEEPNVGIVGPSIIDKKGNSQNPYKSKSFFLRWWLEYFCYPLNRFLPDSLSSSDLLVKFKNNPVSRVMGAFFMTKKTTFNKVGGFDPQTFLFAEEMILSKKMRDINMQTCFIPEIHLLHDHSAIINKKYASFDRLFLRFDSEAYYYQNYENVPKFVIKLTRMNLHLYLYKKLFFGKIKNFILR